MRKNPKGMHREQWLHAAGCRRYFNAERDTVTYRISGTYKIGEKAPSEAGK
jgi:sarcosine oxidase subunit delta